MLHLDLLKEIKSFSKKIKLLHKSKINWEFMGFNHPGVRLVENNLDKTNKLLENPSEFDTGNSEELILLKQHSKAICSWMCLSSNITVLEFLEKYHLKEADWYWLYKNPAALGLLERHRDKIWQDWLSSSPHAIYLLLQNQDKINWFWLSSNPAATNLLKENPDKINWNNLAQNPHPDAVHLISQNLNKIDWCYISLNPNAIHLLEKNPDEINWLNLSQNPAALELLEKNLDKVNWHHLYCNPAAIHLLEEEY